MLLLSIFDSECLPLTIVTFRRGQGLVGWQCFYQKLGCFSFKRSESGSLKSVFLLTDRQHFDSHLLLLSRICQRVYSRLSHVFLYLKRTGCQFACNFGKRLTPSIAIKGQQVRSEAGVVSKYRSSAMRTLRLRASQAMDHTPAEHMARKIWLCCARVGRLKIKLLA